MILSETELETASLEILWNASTLAMKEKAEAAATEAMAKIENHVPAAREIVIASTLRELLLHERKVAKKLSDWLRSR